MKVVVDVDLESALAAQKQVIERLEEPTGLLTMLGRCLEDYEQELFRTGGEGKWQADDPVTAELKGSALVLVDKGELAHSLTHARPIGSDAVHVNQGSAFYGRFLRDGDRGMPKRDPAPAPGRDDVADWATRTARYLITGEGR